MWSKSIQLNLAHFHWLIASYVGVLWIASIHKMVKERLVRSENHPNRMKPTTFSFLFFYQKKNTVFFSFLNGKGEPSDFWAGLISSEDSPDPRNSSSPGTRKKLDRCWFGLFRNFIAYQCVMVSNFVMITDWKGWTYSQPKSLEILVNQTWIFLIYENLDQRIPFMS